MKRGYSGWTKSVNDRDRVRGKGREGGREGERERKGGKKRGRKRREGEGVGPTFEMMAFKATFPPPL
jgi:hypothetical protein